MNQDLNEMRRLLLTPCERFLDAATALCFLKLFRLDRA
jgi:hypothetical protein